MTSSPTRVLLNLRLANQGAVDDETARKAALYLMRQPGVIRAQSGMGGSLELHYDAQQVTLTELGRALSKAGLRLGIV